MDTRSRKFSHSIFIKTIVFLLSLFCAIGSIYAAINIYKITNGNIEIVFENSYLESHSFKREYDSTISQLTRLIYVYKSEENILEGHTIDLDEYEYLVDSEEQIDTFEEIKKSIIADELENYNRILSDINKKDGLIYYGTDGEHILTNTEQTEREQFEDYPVYFIKVNDNWEIYPSHLEKGYYYYGFPHNYYTSNSENTKLFIAYTDDYIESISSEWNDMKIDSNNLTYYLLIFVAVFFLSVLYLIVTTGRNSFDAKKVHMQLIDKLYVDINLIILLGLSSTWLITGSQIRFNFGMVEWIIYALTLPIVSIFIILLLSLIRHMKNNTFFKHTLLFTVFRAIYQLVKSIYDSGSIGVKVAVVVILYPIITVASLIFFPIIIGLAVWLALKQVKSFNAIQKGTELMKEGNLQHQIEVKGTGEFATLASNINAINDGFKQAVYNELKNERMKTELITNVSHDIRTPLTSLITYTDLLKTETDSEKIQEYIKILDQKSKRLKVLTDDLFAAAKASSGDIPVDLQTINVVALVKQGIGEVSEQISEKNLDFKFNYSDEQMYVAADGKLLWRSIENIFSNIFNYGLEGSRVYIDITDQGDRILISFKNISKYELNITEDELMERFKRGDESRSSNGSGLGLSITKSLIENQNGNFEIDIDGDLFKSTIYLPRAIVDETSENFNEFKND